MEGSEQSMGIGEWNKYYSRLSNKTLAQEYKSYDLEDDSNGQRGISLVDVVKKRAGEMDPEIWAGIKILKESPSKYVDFYLDAQREKLDGESKLYVIKNFLRDHGIKRLYIAGGMKMDLEDIQNPDQIRAAFNSRNEKGQEIYGKILQDYHQKKGLII